MPIEVAAVGGDVLLSRGRRRSDVVQQAPELGPRPGAEVLPGAFQLGVQRAVHPGVPGLADFTVEEGADRGERGEHRRADVVAGVVGQVLQLRRERRHNEQAGLDERQEVPLHEVVADHVPVDFELRGPGDVLGTRQSGSLPLRVADLVRDKALLEEARIAAFNLVETGEFDQPEFAPLKIRVLERFAKLMDLQQTG